MCVLTGLLVIEDDVRRPDGFRVNSHFLDIAEYVRIPSEQNIIPFLHTRAHKHTNQSHCRSTTNQQLSFSIAQHEQNIFCDHLKAYFTRNNAHNM